MCRQHSAPRKLCGCGPVHRQEGAPPEQATATPDWLADMMLDLAGFRAGETLLDPCAGTGTILERAVARGASYVEFLELNEARANALRARGYPGTRADMTRITRTSVYDVVAMNPDFRDGRWATMIAAGYAFVQPACTLVTLIPSGWYQSGVLPYMHEGAGFNAMLASCSDYAVTQLPERTFEIAGAAVPTSIMTVRRPAP